MKILFLSLIIVLATVPSYADEVFPDSGIRDMRVLRIGGEQENAVMRNGDGGEAVVFPGDTIGYEEAVVTEIGRFSVVIRTGKTVMTIPLYSRAVQSATAGE